MQNTIVRSKEMERIRHKEAFMGFTDTEFASIQENLYMRQYKKGQVLFDNGDSRNRIYFLLDGLVRIERYDADGIFCYLDYIKPENLFPYGGMFVDEFYHYSAYSVTDIEVYYIPTEIFEKITKQNATQLLFCYQELSNHLEYHEKKIQYCVSSSAVIRVVETLTLLMKQLGEEYFSKSIRIPYPITLKEIAASSGTTRETASTVIKSLRKEKKLEYCQKHFIFRDIDFFLKSEDQDLDERNP